MAKNKSKEKETKTATAAANSTKRSKKSKFFKLGDNASLFYDSVSGKKVANKEVVEFTDIDMSTEKFAAAKRHGHLVLAEDEDLENYQNPDEEVEINEDLAAFLALTSKEEKAKYIKDTYTLDEEEEKALDAMDETQLLAEFKQYEGIED